MPLKRYWYLLALGSSILFSYPEIGTIAGVQGAITYAACSALPVLSFAFLVPKLRSKLPEGFILTMWVKERYGLYAGLYLSFLTWVIGNSWRWLFYMTDECSVATMFLYMVAELSSLQQVINALTNLNGLPVVIVEVLITSIYTCTPDISPIWEFANQF